MNTLRVRKPQTTAVASHGSSGVVRGRRPLVGTSMQPSVSNRNASTTRITRQRLQLANVRHIPIIQQAPIEGRIPMPTTRSNADRARRTQSTRIAPVMQHSSLDMVEVVDLTCTPRRTARRIQPPVILGIPSHRLSRAHARAPLSGRTHSAAKGSASLSRKRTAAEKMEEVSPSKKCCNGQDIMCPICFETISLSNNQSSNQVMSTNCGHLFCKACIIACLERSKLCPICRKSQTYKDIHPIYISENI